MIQHRTTTVTPARPRPACEIRRKVGRSRIAIVAILVLASLGGGRAARPALFGLAVALAQQHELQPPAAHRPDENAANEGAVAEDRTAEEGHENGVWSLVARLINFAILAGTLFYFLRPPVASYLARRREEIRNDLVTAAEMRRTASEQLAEIDRRLKALPGEIEALKARGVEEIVSEDARIREAAEAERQRLLEQTRREIDLQLRIARRELMAHTANLAVGLASTRIRRTITADDQLRLVDRYLAQVTAESQR